MRFTKMYRTHVCTFVVLVLSLNTASAQQWAQEMFKVTSHDFGTVARNAKTQFDFEFENLYAVDIHVASVRASCGCTTPKIETEMVRTYETGRIRAIYNTDRFLGRRSATITVTFDKPRYAEVQLSVTGHIRSDIVMEPGGLEFGSIDQGSVAEQKTRITYYGHSGWMITDVRGNRELIDAELRPVQGSRGRLAYDLIARLNPNAPVGYLADQLILVTNDPSTPNIPVSLQGQIVAPITVSPNSLFLGVLKPGETVQKNIIVRGKSPFRILSAHSADERLEIKLNDAARNVHVLPLTFKAGERTEKVNQTIEVQTDLADATSASCRVMAAIVQPAESN